MSSDTELECSVCRSPFDIDAEGGIDGEFGIIPVAFCPVCLSCIQDMAEQLWGESSNVSPN